MQHQQLASGKWQQLSLCEQLANIGSEVSRAQNWLEKGDVSYSHQALYRALELIDLSQAQRYSYPTHKELARIRECLVDYFLGENSYRSTQASWTNYFNAFGIAAYLKKKNKG